MVKRLSDMPEVEVLLIEAPEPEGPYGAKGVGEIGLNMMSLETAEHLVVIDAGLMFPEDPMLGIDIVIPDFSYLRERRDQVAAVVLTHGHEDHIGAVPFLLKEIPVPVYGTPALVDLMRQRRMAPTENFRRTVFEDSSAYSGPAIRAALRRFRRRVRGR